MMTKPYRIVLAAVISATAILYFFNLNTSSPTSEYELLAIADHEKLASGEFSILRDSEGQIERIAFKSSNTKSKVATKTQNNIFAPAINAAPISKFLNGNLPTTTPSSTNAPNLLSQTGAFSDLVALEPSQGLIPYDMIEPFWSDGATKKRWMAIPNNGTHNSPSEQIQYSQDNAWNFPKGAVLIKHFELGGKRLETRFEVKGDDDVYYYLTYKWNAAQTDATLLNASVDEDVIVNGVTQSWHYPSRNECASCHFAETGSVLGPKTRNLNKAIRYPSTGVEMNQLVNLSEMGILTENITTSNVGSYPAVAAKDDPNASLEDRARTYLDVNCASCHDPRLDNIATFDARYDIPLEDQGFIYGSVTYDEGLDNPGVIVPQEVSRSMVHFRMNSTQTGIEMPPISKDVIDIEGVQLIADWINSLEVPNFAAPQADFTASTSIGNAPLNVNFDASASSDSDGDALTYSWDFGDGASAQGVNVNHTYTNVGTFTATLTVSDGQESDQATTVITTQDNTTAPSVTSAVSFTDASNLIQQNNFSGLAMAVVDMNNDGKDDIVQFNQARTMRIQYQNNPGQAFTTHNFGQVSTRNQWSTAIADVDQNGFNDVLCGGAYDNIRIIKNNNGSDSYTQETLPNSNIFIQGSNFIDINNDGWADIFACHDDAESRAYANNQNGQFSYSAELIRTRTNPSSDNSGNYASMWIDYDNDRDMDLYISKCRGGVNDPNDPRRINMLWRNDGNNNFTEVAAQANLQIKDQTWLSDFGDIDNDGDLDAIVINHGTGPNLMRNNGNGTFTEVTANSGLLPTLRPQDFYGIQGFFRDFNNDGFLDLMVSGDAHFIFYNKGDGTFENAPNPFNSNQIQSFTVGDLNHDGFLDIYAGYASGLNTPTAIKDRIWLNSGNSNNYLNIQLKGTQSNSNGIGARVELYGAWGIQVRDVRSGEGYGLNNSFTQHFGIGSSAQVDRVVVRWPSGTVSEVINPGINQFLSIIEEETDCQDSDGDGVCDADDICDDNDDTVDSDSDGVPDGCDVCDNGDDTIDSDGDGTPDACDTQDCPSINFNDYTLTSYANQDFGPATVQDNGNTLYMTGNAWKALEINYTITPNTILKFDFRSTTEGEIHEVAFDNDNIFGPDVRIVPFGNQGYAGNVPVDRYPGNQSWKSYTIAIGQATTGTYKYMVLSADDDAGGSGNSFYRNLSIFEDANSNGIPDECEGSACADSDNDGVCDTDDICQGGDDTIDINGNGVPDFCDTSSTCTDITVRIDFDRYAPEVSWQLNDSNGQTILEGNRYTQAENSTTLIEAACLPAGCYEFVMNDAYGDGICCGYGQGSYSVTDNSGTVLASGGEYTFSETKNFCVGDTNTSNLRTAIETPSSSLILSPVPADLELNLSYSFASGPSGQIGVTIFDNAFKRVYERIISKESFSKQIDVSNLPEGIYLIQVSNQKETLTERFIVKH